jgi:hypothetical protein
MTKSTYQITIDRSKSFDELIADGKFDWKNNDITEEHFPIEKQGESSVEAILVCFAEALTDEEVNEKMEKEGLRRADTIETLSFAAQHPEVQIKYAIVSGAFWARHDGHRYFLCLGGDRDGFCLHLDWFYRGDRWLSQFRFLAVRKLPLETRNLESKPLDSCKNQWVEISRKTIMHCVCCGKRKEIS